MREWLARGRASRAAEQGGEPTLPIRIVALFVSLEERAPIAAACWTRALTMTYAAESATRGLGCWC